MVELTTKQLAVLSYLYDHCQTPTRNDGIMIHRQWNDSGRDEVKQLAAAMKLEGIETCREFWDVVENLQGCNLAHLVADGRTAYILPEGQQEVMRRRRASKAAKAQEPIKVLFVAANPLTTDRLALDIEHRQITQKVRASEHRDLLSLECCWATQPSDLLQALNQHRPEIVHFSGHGTASAEIVLAADATNAKPVSGAALKSLFHTLKDNIRLVVLNACFSEPQAQAICDEIDCVIGMRTEIADDAAIVFAAHLYSAIGFGRSIKNAFDQAVTAVQLEGLGDADAPQLLSRTGANPEDIVLIANTHRAHTEVVGQEAELLKRAPGPRKVDKSRAVNGARDAIQQLRHALQSLAASREAFEDWAHRCTITCRERFENEDSWSSLNTHIDDLSVLRDAELSRWRDDVLIKLDALHDAIDYPMLRAASRYHVKLDD